MFGFGRRRRRRFDDEKRGFFGRIWRFLGPVLILGVVAGAIELSLLWFVFSDSEEMPDSDRLVLQIDLTDGLRQPGAASPLDILDPQPPSLGAALDLLKKARRDPRVKGVLVRMGSGRLSFVEAQELGDAVARLRDEGRFAVAYAPSFGDGLPANAEYALAAGFDEIWVQRLGSVGVAGFRIETPFARGALDSIGIEPQFLRRGQYKSAPESYTASEMSPAHREMMEGLVADLTDQLVAAVAKGRGMTQAEARAAVIAGPYLAEDALKARLIDRIGYADEAEQAALERAGDGAALVDADPYEFDDGEGFLESWFGDEPEPTTIAVIRGTGAIMPGDGGSSFLEGPSIGADSMARAFDQAMEDEDVKAIVFRIDSPGGSVTASEIVRRAANRAQAAGKPIIVTMGRYAASGGYWVSMDADVIVAQPATLTGSIGVYGGKMASRRLWEKLGVGWSVVSGSDGTELWSTLDPYTPRSRAWMERNLDAIYDAFVSGVARGRGMPRADAEAAAQGRIWTGAQAKALGLVDALGGYEEAYRQTRLKLGLAEDASLTLREFPRASSRFGRLMQGLGLARVFAPEMKAEAAALRDLQAALAELRPILAPPQGELVMPPIGEIR